MKKITLLLLFILFSITGYSQLTEGFESTTGPDALPSTNWTLASGNWAVFDNGVGTGQRWGNAPIVTPSNAFQGDNAAYINRENLGTEGLISQDYLSTPLVTIPANGQLRFFARSFASGNQGTLYQIRVAPSTASQTNPAAYNLVQQWDETTLSATFNVYEEKIVDLSAFASQQVYVSFVRVHTQLPGGLNGAGDRWLVDNVNIVQRCLEPTNLTFSAITQNGATLNWANPSGATSWEIEIVLATATPTGTGVIYNGTLPYLATGLLPNTAYKFFVRAICNTGFSSAWSVASANFTTGTAPPECGGNFVDAGGPTANYPNNSNSTTTICPTIPGEKVTVTFTSFNTEATWDGLYVYNGNGAVPANLIASANPAGNVPGGLAGSYWGTAIPGPFTSSATDGCLTFVFRSDGFVNNPGWVANITCAPPPACEQPIALVSSAVTSNSATLAWTNVGVATTWEVIALPCTAPAPNASTTGFITTSSNPHTFTDLASATCYNLYVRGNCSSTSNGVSAWSGPRTITTLVAPPECGGNFVDAGGPTANYPNNSNTTTTICPTIPGEKVTVTFTSFNTEATWDGLYVYDGNGVVPANLIASANPAGNVPGGLAGSYWGTTIPGPFTSSAADGCLTFVFRSDGAVNNPGWVANITCAPPPACQQPITLVTSAVTSNSATLAWTNVGVATTWEVIALPCTAPAPDASTTGFITTSTNIYTFTELAASTCYNLYVRGNCSSSSNGVSLWSGPRTITTQVAPPVCGGTFTDVGGPNADYTNSLDSTVTVCPTAGNVVTVTFTAFNTEATWDGLYVFDGNSVTSPQIASANPAGNVPGGLAGSFWGDLTGNLPGPFTSSSLDGCLTFRFRTDGSGTRSGWVANVTCAAAPNCARPTALAATTITSTSALLGWTESNPAVTQWEIIHLPFGSPAPTSAATGILTSSNPALISGLLPGTRYTYYVRAICPTSGTSAWSIGSSFTTLVINDECAGAIFTPVNSSSICQQVTAGTITGATASLPATTAPCVGTADDDVWFQFVATNPFLNVALQNITGTTTNLNYGVYAGQCGTLAQIFCSPINETSAVVNNLTIGQTYFVRVYSNANTPQTVNFNLCITTPSSCITGQSACQDLNYQNTTGVDSQGTVGCLGSTPNPTYYTINIATTGPINLLLTQSTTQGGAPNLDVDYAAWGPFPSQAAACAAIGNPPTLAPGIGVPISQTTGCSFSIEATENLNIVNAVAGQVYLILITNFSDDPGFISLTQTNATAIGAGTYQCCPNAFFSYNPATYCQLPGASNPIAVIDDGSEAGTFSSTPGLVFVNTATGEIDLAASTPGNYLVTNTVAATASCLEFVKTFTISIVAPTSATISYGATSPTKFCRSISTLQAVNQTGTLGGTYSAIPNIGLSINPSTGAINPSLSSAGIYTITYGIPGSVCTVGNPSTQVEIIALPALVSPGNQTVCNSYTLPALAVGNYYSQAGGVGAPLDINIPLETSQLVYIYAINGDGCASEQSFNVAIGQAPTPSLNVTQTACNVQTGTIEVTAPIGAVSGLPSNLFISEVTDAATGSLTYVEIFNGTGTSVDLSNYKLKVYNNGGTTPNCDLLLSGTLLNNSTNIVKLSSDADIGGVTPNQSFAGCGGVNTDDNIRLTTSADVEIDIWGRIDGVSFTPLNQPGYTYRRNNTASVPSLTWNAADWTALDPENYSNLGNFTSLTTGFQYNIDGGAFQSSTIFNNVAPGDHIIRVLDLASGCLSVPVTVTINPVPVTPTFGNLAATTPVCSGGNAVFSLLGTPNATVTYTINGGANQTVILDTAGNGTVIVNAATGNTTILLSEISLASCTTTLSNTATVVVNPNPTVTNLVATTPVCFEENAVFTLTGTPNATVTYTINNNANQTIVLDANGNAPVTITAVTSNTTILLSQISLASCTTSISNTATVVVNPLLQVAISGDCVGSAYTLTANPVNGSFDSLANYSWKDSSGNPIGGNTQSIIVTQPGEYTVNVFSGGCPSSAVFSADNVSCVIQKGISVNNDGKNDTFDLSGYNVRKLSIYNRLGVKAYSKNNYINEWGGQSDSGDELPDGTYYYVIERNDGETKTGWIYINREQ